MLNNLNILFLIMSLMGIFISFSSINWFTAWMGLEINMISFIPFFLKNKNILSTESAMNYFLIQASASSLFMFFCVFSSMNNFTHLFFIDQVNTLLILIPLIMKLGGAPFHFWFVIVLQGLDWLTAYMLMTLQKLAPLFILAFFMKSNFILLFSLLSVIFGSIGGLNQTLLKKILAFSSINHLGWMMASINLSKIVLLNYFLIYMFMNLFMVYFFNENLFTQITQSSSYLNWTSWIVGILSLGGLPPFLGFLPKWMIIQLLIMNDFIVVSVIFVATALITLYYYLRLIYMSAMLASSTQKWTKYTSTAPVMKLLMVSSSSLGLIFFNFLLT